MKNEIDNLKKYASENNVPIIEDEGLEVLLKYVKEVSPSNILEIGTAIGYSAICMSEVSESKITTFEREEELCQKAKENIRIFNKEEQIKIIEEDFLKYDLKSEKFDFIYIDGAKAQYYNFFKKVENNMTDKAVILFDNLSFHGYVNNESKKAKASKNLKQLIRKLEGFNEKIVIEPGYNFKYINKGDGIGILKRSKNV